MSRLRKTLFQKMTSCLFFNNYIQTKAKIVCSFWRINKHGAIKALVLVPLAGIGQESVIFMFISFTKNILLTTLTRRPKGSSGSVFRFLLGAQTATVKIYTYFDWLVCAPSRNRTHIKSLEVSCSIR
jgi:hypothetical protein